MSEKDKIDFLNSIPREGIIRKLLSRDEIKIANVLVKENRLIKGISDDKQKSIMFFKKN